MLCVVCQERLREEKMLNARELRGEVTRLLAEIRKKYEATRRGFLMPEHGTYGLACSLQQMDDIHEMYVQLRELVGDAAIAMIAKELEICPDRNKETGEENNRPEYLSVEVYSCYPEETLLSFLEKTHRVLEKLGYAGKDVESWLSQIAWEQDGSGFGSCLSPSAQLENVMINGQALFAKPIVHGWTQQSLSWLLQPWVTLTLAFETQTVRQNLETVNSLSRNYERDYRYQAGVGKAMWSVMRQCAHQFPQSLVYFTNEIQTGKSWEAILTDRSGVWEFDIALIPHALIGRLALGSEQFAQIDLPEGVGFARTARWSVLPWEEQGNPLS